MKTPDPSGRPEIPDLKSGLLPREQLVMDLAASLWNAWQALPVQHPDDIGDVANAIHRIQDLLATRIARRHYPQGWPTK